MLGAWLSSFCRFYGSAGALAGTSSGRFYWWWDSIPVGHYWNIKVGGGIMYTLFTVASFIYFSTFILLGI